MFEFTLQNQSVIKCLEQAAQDFRTGWSKRIVFKIFCENRCEISFYGYNSLN